MAIVPLRPQVRSPPSLASAEPIHLYSTEKSEFPPRSSAAHEASGVLERTARSTRVRDRPHVLAPRAFGGHHVGSLTQTRWGSLRHGGWYVAFFFPGKN